VTSASQSQIHHLHPGGRHGEDLLRGKLRQQFPGEARDQVFQTTQNAREKRSMVAMHW
jgi:hypothetical protein